MEACDGLFWGLILASEMSANPALLPPGFYASKTHTGERQVLTWTAFDVLGGPPIDPATLFRTCRDSEDLYHYSRLRNIPMQTRRLHESLYSFQRSGVLFTWLMDWTPNTNNTWLPSTSPEPLFDASGSSA